MTLAAIRATLPVTVGWNFERRRDTCARFLLGVYGLTKGAAGRDTSLEAVRSRMRLSPERGPHRRPPHEGDSDVPHRLALVGDVVTRERRTADGTFEAVPPG